MVEEDARAEEAEDQGRHCIRKASGAWYAPYRAIIGR
jgi:hypothetical protein